MKHLMLGFMVVCGLLLSSRPAPAQSIAPCPDCARVRPCPLCAWIAKCCQYESTTPDDRKCTALRDGPQHWTILTRGYSACFTHIDDQTNDEDCYGQLCSSYSDPCANGGCTPGYHQTEWCNSEASLDECGCCYDASPIVISLRGNGYHFTAARSGVMFDINGLGKVLWIGWPADGDDAWLALDRNGNGAIDNGGELFGNVTRLHTGKAAANGYEALAEFDDNHDGVIDRSDAVYASLRLWSDVNHDGKSQPSELRSLASAGVRSIATAYRTSQKQDEYGNQFRLRSTVVFDSGATRFSYDVYPVAAPVAGLTAVALGRCPAKISTTSNAVASQQ
jgi:hypothetical protein